jgi:hypothetical protein
MPPHSQQFTEEQADIGLQLAIDMDEDYDLKLVNWPLFHLVRCSEEMDFTGTLESVVITLMYADEHGLQCSNNGRPLTLSMFMDGEEEAEDVSPLNSNAEAAEPQGDDPVSVA